MRFTGIFLLAICMQVYATGRSQYISLHEKNASLKKVFKEIHKQVGYKFFYEDELINQIGKINVDVENVRVEDALNTCFKNLPFGYKISGNTIIVTPKSDLSVSRNSNTDLKTNKLQTLNDIVIKGKVINEDGQALEGASVKIAGSNKGVTTNEQGEFNIHIPEQPATVQLIISYVGYTDVIVNAKQGEELRIVLKKKVIAAGEDVVVVAFGKQKKESVVGAVTTISPAELVASNTQLSQGFAGHLSGVIAVSPSGEPGNNSTNFWIRGVSTLGNTSPLIFLDGIEISNADMNAIDPSNIESFSILKDASATALYGARGANGVLLITTKHGRVSALPKITALVENIFSAPTKVVHFTDAVTYMNLYNEARFNDNPFQALKYSQDKINGTKQNLNPYIYPNVDWYDLLFRNFATSQHANVNIRGGNKNATYYSGISFYNEYGMLKRSPTNNFNNNIINQRYNFVNNVDISVTKTTNLELNLNADFVKYNGPVTDASTLFGEVMGSNPVNFPAYYPNKDGDSSHILFGNTTGGFYANNTFQNPYADMVKGYKQSFSSTILANLRLNQNLDFITKGLYFNAIASIKNWSYSEIDRQYTPYYYQLASSQKDPTTGQYTYNISQIGSGGAQALAQSGSSDGDRTLESQLSFNYDRNFGLHNITGLVVYHQKEYNVNNPGTSITGSLPQRSEGLAGRITYSFDSRYFLEGNFGYTGSDNFAIGHKWGFFPSVGLGYLISNEKYFEKLKSIISSLKIRASYGLAGNDQIGGGRFPYLGIVNLSATNGYTFGYNFNNSYGGVQITQFANPDISWEIAHKANVGIDVTIKNDLSLSIDVFQENRDKIFQQRATVPSTVGVGTIAIYANIDKFQNRGIDISLNYNHSFNKNFFASVKGTFTYARNKILAYDEPDYIYPYKFYRGRPVNQLWGLKAEHLFIDNNEIANSPKQTFNSVVSPGDIKYTSVSNKYDGLNQVGGNDYVPMGHPSVPEITYGIGFTIRYKKLDVGAFFQGVGNVSFFMNSIQPFGQYQSNLLSIVANSHWSQNNQNIYALYPRLSEIPNPNNTPNSSWWLRNASFVRLKNVEIGYSFNKIVRLYLNGKNLLTLSPFKYWDPELSINTGTGNGLAYPPQRQLAVGLQFNLN